MPQDILADLTESLRVFIITPTTTRHISRRRKHPELQAPRLQSRSAHSALRMSSTDSRREIISTEPSGSSQSWGARPMLL